MEITRRNALEMGVSTLAAAALAGCTADTEGDDESTADTDTTGDDDTEAADDTDTDSAESTSDDEVDPDTDDADDDEQQSLELLAEEHVDHDHACLHAEFDERTELTVPATESEAEPITETHVIWEAIYEGEHGYVTFEVDEHAHDGPFVFYTADGTVTPVVGSEEEQGAVEDDACEPLDEYLEVASEDGEITLELTAA